MCLFCLKRTGFLPLGEWAPSLCVLWQSSPVSWPCWAFLIAPSLFHSPVFDLVYKLLKKKWKCQRLLVFLTFILSTALFCSLLRPTLCCTAVSYTTSATEIRIYLYVSPAIKRYLQKVSLIHEKKKGSSAYDFSVFITVWSFLSIFIRTKHN